MHSFANNILHLDADSFMITLNFALTFAKQLTNTTSNLIPRKFDEAIILSFRIYDSHVNLLFRVHGRMCKKTCV